MRRQGLSAGRTAAAAAVLGVALGLVASEVASQDQRRAPRPGALPVFRDVAPDGRFRRETRGGQPILYEIRGLGTGREVATARIGGQRFDITDTLRRHALGGGPRTPGTDFFDQCTGQRDNWIGSAGSGQRTIPAGGIGDVRVPGLNRFDRAARRHDIESWLEATFQVGSRVTVHVDERVAEEYVVKGFWAIQQDVGAEYRNAAAELLVQAQTLAAREGNREWTAVVRGLQRDFPAEDAVRRSLLDVDCAGVRSPHWRLCEIIRGIFTDWHFAGLLVSSGRPDARVALQALCACPSCLTPARCRGYVESCRLAVLDRCGSCPGPQCEHGRCPEWEARCRSVLASDPDAVHRIVVE